MSFDNTQAKSEGWSLNTWSKVISAYGWQFSDKAIEETGVWSGEVIQKMVMDHVEARAREGSAYHIEALQSHYFGKEG